MRSEHAVVEAGEQATTERGAGRPTPKYIAAMRDLLEALDRSPTPCEACKASFASVVRCVTPPIVVCRTCASASEYRGPLGARRLQLRVALGGGR